MDGSQITEIIVTAFSTGAVGAIISGLMTRRKYKAEAAAMEEALQNSRMESYQKSIDYIQEKMIDLSKKYEAESEVLRKRNEELDVKITDLNSRLQDLMEWVVVDNNKYRSWLETELLKLNPDISFPHCPEPPITKSSNS